MQVLDEQGLSPYRTFDSISRFAEQLAAYGGKAFLPRITTHSVSAHTTVTVIEPPCGSNTMVVQSAGETLVIDTGYACYREEMHRLLRERIPGFDVSPKQALITHADVDHCGLLPLFDVVFMIFRMRAVNCIDVTALNALEQIYAGCRRRGITMVLSHLNAQPETMLTKAGLLEKIGMENCCEHLGKALERARTVVEA